MNVLLLSHELLVLALGLGLLLVDLWLRFRPSASLATSPPLAWV